MCNKCVQTKKKGKRGGLPRIGTGIALPQGSRYIVKNGFLGLQCGEESLFAFR